MLANSSASSGSITFFSVDGLHHACAAFCLANSVAKIFLLSEIPGWQTGFAHGTGGPFFSPCLIYGIERTGLYNCAVNPEPRLSDRQAKRVGRSIRRNASLVSKNG